MHFGTLLAPLWHPFGIMFGTQDELLYQDYIEIMSNSPFWPPRVPKLIKHDPQMAPKWPPQRRPNGFQMGPRAP